MCTVAQSVNVNNIISDSLHVQSVNGMFCDVKIHVADKVIWTHSCVFSIFSSYLKNIYLSRLSINTSNSSVASATEMGSATQSVQYDWSFSKPLEIKLLVNPEYSCLECARKVVDFVYLGRINVSNEHLHHVETIARVFNMPQLLSLCSTYKEKRKEHVSAQSDNSYPESDHKSLPVNDYVHMNLLESEPILMPVKLGESNVGINNDLKNPVFLSDKFQVDFNVSELETNTICRVTEDDILTGEGSLSESTQKSIFPCSKCKLKFKTKLLLCQHRLVHLRKSYVCYTCNSSYFKVHELLKHLREVDHQELVCSLCMYEAESNENLKKHLHRHQHKKPFFCGACDIRFQTRTALNLHTPKHSTEKPYVCNMCSKGFKWKHALQNHMIVHTPEKKHLCDQCGFSTAHQSTFKTHKLVHSGHTFKCPYLECKFQAVRKQNLKGHLLTHTKEKPFQCEICGQAFSLVRNMRRHARMHDSSNKLMSCSVCQFQTTRLDKLKDHVKKHTSKSNVSTCTVKARKIKCDKKPKQVLHFEDFDIAAEVELVHDQSVDCQPVSTMIDSDSNGNTFTVLSIDGSGIISSQTVQSTENITPFPEEGMQTVYIFP